MPVLSEWTEDDEEKFDKIGTVDITNICYNQYDLKVIGHGSFNKYYIMFLSKVLPRYYDHVYICLFVSIEGGISRSQVWF